MTYCDYDPPKVFETRICRARKTHICYECGAEIANNEHYHVHEGLWEESWDRYKVCLECEAVRSELTLFYEDCYCPAAYGQLWHDASEARRDGWNEEWCLSADALRAQQQRKASWKYTWRVREERGERPHL